MPSVIIALTSWGSGTVSWRRPIGDGAFVLGDRPSFADVALFLMFENLHGNDLAGPYASCPRLAAHAARMAARLGIAAYVASPKRFPVQRLPG